MPQAQTAAEAGEDSSLADLALQLSRQTASQASSVEVGVDGGAADDDEAASLALAMQMMQQEQALAAFYQEQGGAGFGFDTPEDSELGGALEGEQGNDWIPNEEVEAVVTYLKSQGEPAYVDSVTDEEILAAGPGGGGNGGGEGGDALYDQAVALVCRERKASTSFVQRHLKIGYNRAARLVEQMESQGVIGPANHVGKREVLAGDHGS